MKPLGIKNYIYQKPEKSPAFFALWDAHGRLDLICSRLQKIETCGYGNVKKPIVLLWDILAERRAEGEDIFYHLAELRAKLPFEHQKDDLQVIIGNHDIWWFRFFEDALYARKYPDNKLFIDQCIERYLKFFYKGSKGYHKQGAGILSLLRYLPKHSLSPKASYKEIIKYLFFHAPNILNCMKKNEHGKVVMNEMYQTRLCTRIGHTLFIHTEPTRNAIRFLVAHNFDIDAINAEWQGIIERLFDGNPLDDDWAILDNIADTLLDTNNRFRNGDTKYSQYFPFSWEQAEKMKQQGIRRIVHGHEYTQPWTTKIFYGIELAGCDHGLFDEIYVPPVTVWYQCAARAMKILQKR